MALPLLHLFSTSSSRANIHEPKTTNEERPPRLGLRRSPLHPRHKSILKPHPRLRHPPRRSLHLQTPLTSRTHSERSPATIRLQRRPQRRRPVPRIRCGHRRPEGQSRLVDTARAARSRDTHLVRVGASSLHLRWLPPVCTFYGGDSTAYRYQAIPARWV